MTLCYYITGHGFGHAIRTTQILKALRPDVRLILKTTAPERVFREELAGRDFEYVRAEYDCGSLQSDSVTTLPRATLDRYRQIAEANEAGLQDEVAWLKREGVQCVVSDVPSFPLRAAREAGVPGIAVANFTWHDIYAEYVQTNDDVELLNQMASEYGMATRALISPLCTPNIDGQFPQVEHIPLVARKGRNIRAALTESLGLATGTHLGLLYVGGWGLNINWAALGALNDWVFLLDRSLPISVANVRSFDQTEWRYADVAASVDAVITKPGYGTLTECIANSVPLVYVPRQGFAEYAALVDGMTPWGGGIPLSNADFFAGRWQNALQTALSCNLNRQAYQTNGAAVIAHVLEGYLP